MKLNSKEVNALYCGEGVFKTSQEKPHPEMHRCHSAAMNKKKLHTIVVSCIDNKQHEILKELNIKLKFGIFYDNTGKQGYKLISLLDVIYLMYFRFLTLIGRR